VKLSPATRPVGRLGTRAVLGCWLVVAVAAGASCAQPAGPATFSAHCVGVPRHEAPAPGGPKAVRLTATTDRRGAVPAIRIEVGQRVSIRTSQFAGGTAAPYACATGVLDRTGTHVGADGAVFSTFVGRRPGASLVTARVTPMGNLMVPLLRLVVIVRPVLICSPKPERSAPVPSPSQAPLPFCTPKP